nr:hypothetical protein [Cohnella nanjingensis]
MNEEQRELFDVLELDSPPYTFQTVADQNFYPFPSQFDVTKIKTVTFQMNDSTNGISFVEVPFVRNDDRQFAPHSPWYTITSNAMFLYVPDKMPSDRQVYIYLDSDPTEITSDNLSSMPDLPTKFHELLKLGVLVRIAEARKDVIMQNNYYATYKEKLDDILWQRKLAEPEWTQPVDGNYRPQWTTQFYQRGWRDA